jgi:hypothetical protein
VNQTRAKEEKQAENKNAEKVIIPELVFTKS